MEVQNALLHHHVWTRCGRHHTHGHRLSLERRTRHRGEHRGRSRSHHGSSALLSQLDAGIVALLEAHRRLLSSAQATLIRRKKGIGITKMPEPVLDRTGGKRYCTRAGFRTHLEPGSVALGVASLVVEVRWHARYGDEVCEHHLDSQHPF